METVATKPVLLYQVKDSEGTYGAYLEEDRAKRHLEACGKNRSGMFLEPMEIFEIGKQRVVIEGNIVGYQFEKLSNGKRTMTHKVYHLEWHGKLLTGQIYFHDLCYQMVYDSIVKKWYHMESKHACLMES